MFASTDGRRSGCSVFGRICTVGLKGQAGQLLVNLLAEDHRQADGRGKHRLLLEAYGYRCYRVGGLDYLLKRSDVAAVGKPL